MYIHGLALPSWALPRLNQVLTTLDQEKFDLITVAAAREARLTVEGQTAEMYSAGAGVGARPQSYSP